MSLRSSSEPIENFRNPLQGLSYELYLFGGRGDRSMGNSGDSSLKYAQTIGSIR